MPEFKKRGKDFEYNYKREEALGFKFQVRRNKLLGLWAGRLMGMDKDTAAVYAKQVVISDFEEPGDDDVLNKVLGDLQGKGVETSKHLVRKEMDSLLTVARGQVLSEES